MNFENIPQEMKNLKNWICWRLEDGKKIPYHVCGEKVSTTDPNDWNTFDNIINNKYFKKYKFDGVGFVFTKNTGLVGIDFDHIRDPVTGIIDPITLEEIRDFNSYTEVSQSGTGVHIICRGTLPVDGRKIGNREMYVNKRFFAITGEVVDGYPVTINKAQEAINNYYTKWFPEKEKPTTCTSPIKSDEEIIFSCRSAANKEKFVKLFDEGNKEDYKGDDSAADQALCSLIAFYTQDPGQIDRIFLKSRLYREKWNRTDYKDRTINTAIQGQKAVYTGKDIEEIHINDLKSIKIKNSYRMPELAEILPQDHFVNKVTTLISGLTDAYYEYNVCAGLWLLSSLVEGKPKLCLKQVTLKPNLYIELLGQSTISRKSTVVKIGQNLYEDALSTKLYNDEPTREGYIDLLVQHPVSNFVRDEAAGLLSKYHKKYNDGVFDLECNIYDCQDYRKVMSSGKDTDLVEKIITNPYVTHFYATTPEKFCSVMTLDDFYCGYGYRFLYAFPTYPKGRKDIDVKDTDDNRAYKNVKAAIIKLHEKYTNSEEFEFAITKDALKLYNDIMKDLETTADNLNNDSINSAIGRAGDNILKIAMLLEIGMPEPSHTITVESVGVSYRLVTEFFLPSFVEITDRIYADVKNNKIEKAISVIKKSGGECSRSILIRNGHFSSGECNDIINTLIEGEIIEEKIIKSDNAKDKSIYILKKDTKTFKVESNELKEKFAVVSKVSKVRKYTTENNRIRDINLYSIYSLDTDLYSSEDRFSCSEAANFANSANQSELVEKE